MRLFPGVILKGIAALTGLLILAGCENPYMVKLKKEFGWTEERMTRDGWLESRKIRPPEAYCYETLGEAECFETPQEAERHRLSRQNEISKETGRQ